MHLPVVVAELLIREWFIQDGATPHTANATFELLGEKIG